MSTKGKSRFSGQCLYSRKVLVVISLLFVMILFSSPLISVFNEFTPFATGAPDKIVNNERDLRSAIIDAPSGKSVTIALGSDIALTSSTLDIPAGKDITLASNKANGYYKLTSTATGTVQVMVGEISVSTITVNDDGVLKLDGVIVTHECGYWGWVITVSKRGHFIMYDGVISSDIGGVHNGGVFEMYGGEISGNFAIDGGGVRNRGVFRLFDGVISGNSAWNDGGGVYNENVFEMSGGTISGNTASSESGGVYNWGGAWIAEYEYVWRGEEYEYIDGVKHEYSSGVSREFVGLGSQYEGGFTISGGVISGNTAWVGGGVGNYGIFVMSGGEISGNTATGSGGGVYNGQELTRGSFEMSGGTISDNSAEKGGGVYNFFDHNVTLSGTGVISGNRATNLGGGICNDGRFTMINGAISDNSASSGGGVYIGNGEVRLQGGKVFGNTANQGNNVYNENGDLLGNAVALNSRDTCVVLVAVVCVIVVVLFIYFQRRITQLTKEKTKPKQHIEKTVHNGETQNEQ